MKLSDIENPVYRPITVTLETPAEAVEFYLRYNRSNSAIASGSEGELRLLNEVDHGMTRWNDIKSALFRQSQVLDLLNKVRGQ